MKFSPLSFLLALSITSVDSAYWQRVSTFLSCTQDDPSCNKDDQTSAEIIDVTPDGKLAIYSDSGSERLGFVNIEDASAPVAAGVMSLGGEPTSVATVPSGGYAVTCINTSPSFTEPSGELILVKIDDKSEVGRLDVGGQPDSIAISDDSKYIVICIENERDEDLGDGAPPQLPGGFVWVIDTDNVYTDMSGWNVTKVELAGLPNLLYPEDPEPEFVHINSENKAAVSLQENNALVIIDLASATVDISFSAGATSLDKIDTIEDAVITLDTSLADRLREPDALAWINDEYFVTADEGDLDGGSRTITIYKNDGTVAWDSGNTLEHVAVQHGHYPEDRSENKGTEPEGITFFTSKDGTGYIFALLERSGMAVVLTVDPADPAAGATYVQALPTLLRPEGVKKVPGRDLVVVACEEDDRGAKTRGGVNLYEYKEADYAAYPMIASELVDGLPIPFSALSGLASATPPGTDGGNLNKLYTIEDSYYDKSRFFIIAAQGPLRPAKITKAVHIKDDNGILKAAFPLADFSNYTLVNDDNTVNMDPEGVAYSYSGGIWIANEGRGTVGDAARPIEMLNFVIKVDEGTGVVEELVTMPDEVNAIQVRFGFEGVAEADGYLVVIVQRAWGDEENPRVGIYNLETKEWKFVFYPLDEPSSQNGGWVGLSDIATLGGGKFLVLERDNQGGPDASIKKIYQIDLDCYEIEDGSTLEKTMVKDLIPEIRSLNGWTFEKMEGLALNREGKVWVNNDNDGVEDNSGENAFWEVAIPSLTIEPEACEDGTSAGVTVPAVAAFATALVAAVFLL